MCGYNEYVKETEVSLLTPTTLAFIGDAVHTLYVRKRVVCGIDSPSGTLHVAVSRFVNAKAQAAVFDELVACGALDENEQEIARRAKNAHLQTRTKAASSSDYHKATAFEAVLGYNELMQNAARLDAILSLAARISGLDGFIGAHTETGANDR